MMRLVHHTNLSFQEQVLGFRNDGEPRQFNYLFDAAQAIGMDGSLSHGPNAVISMVPWPIYGRLW